MGEEIKTKRRRKRKRGRRKRRRKREGGVGRARGGREQREGGNLHGTLISFHEVSFSTIFPPHSLIFKRERKLWPKS